MTTSTGTRDQSSGEELANSLSHGLAFLLAVAALPVLVRAAAQRGGAADVIAAALFTGTMIVLYGVSTLYTACLSTQSGCAMGCVFCAPGQGGFGRHLRPGEMVAQVIHVRRAMALMGRSKAGLSVGVKLGPGEKIVVDGSASLRTAGPA